MPQMAAAHDHQPLPSSYQPTVEDRQRARGGKYPLISPHERSTFSHLFNNPDLSCHILTSSPSIQIRSLPFVAHSTASFSAATMFAGILRRRRPGHDLLPFLSCLRPPLNLRNNAATKPSVYPRQGRSRHFLPSMAHYTESALLYLPYIALLILLVFSSLCLYP
jgi:hypothetical protein